MKMPKTLTWFVLRISSHLFLPRGLTPDSARCPLPSPFPYYLLPTQPAPNPHPTRTQPAGKVAAGMSLHFVSYVFEASKSSNLGSLEPLASAAIPGRVPVGMDEVVSSRKRSSRLPS